MTRFSLSLVLVLAAGTACNRSSGTAASGGHAAAPAAAAARDELTLRTLNLRIDAPADSLVSDGIVPNSVMVNAARGSVTVGVATDTTPATLDAARTESQMFNPTNVQSETLPDGWILTFDNTGGLGTNYWLRSVRTIGGRRIYCETTADAADKRTYVAGLCRTMRPAT